MARSCEIITSLTQAKAVVEVGAELDKKNVILIDTSTSLSKGIQSIYLASKVYRQLLLVLSDGFFASKAHNCSILNCSGLFMVGARMYR